jgi:hypothetical protein
LCIDGSFVAAMGEAIVSAFSCLVPFLEYDQLSTLPFTVSSMLPIFPDTLHKDVVDLLCGSLLPVTLANNQQSEHTHNSTFANDSSAAILMMVFQHVDKEVPRMYTKLDFIRNIHSHIVKTTKDISKRKYFLTK